MIVKVDLDRLLEAIEKIPDDFFNKRVVAAAIMDTSRNIDDEYQRMMESRPKEE